MEVGACAARVVGLGDGKNSGQLTKTENNHDNMVRLMVGRNLDLKRTETRLGAPKSRIEVRNIISPFFPTHTVSFDMRRGEILGLAGLVGAGRSELAITAFLIARPLGGEGVIDGQPRKVPSPRESSNHFIFLVAVERRKSELLI